jgi:hypothetical protein
MNAHTLSILAAKAWAVRHNLPELTFERPDTVERRSQAVDLLGRDKNGQPRLVLEHTLVESFLDQRTVQIAAVQMLEPLELLLSGQLPAPGHYNLALTPSSVLGLKRKTEHIREWVETWIRETAPTLALGGPGTAPKHFATVIVPDTALELSLSRWPGRDSQFQLGFHAPMKTDEALAPSLERAISAKCPKLAAARKANVGAESVLLLEIHDIALGNPFDLDAVIQGVLPAIEAMPDHIWLVDTIDEPPSVMISKEGAKIGDAIGERFLPFCLRPSKLDSDARDAV